MKFGNGRRAGIFTLAAGIAATTTGCGNSASYDLGYRTGSEAPPPAGAGAGMWCSAMLTQTLLSSDVAEVVKTSTGDFRDGCLAGLKANGFD